MCLTKNTRLDQGKSNGQIFLTLLKAIKGNIILNIYWKLAYIIKQTRINGMVNTVSCIHFYSYSMHGQFTFCCDCQPPNGRNVVLIFVVIIFTHVYSVQEYICVNKHMIFNNGTKKTIDQNASFMITKICKLQENVRHDLLTFFLYKNAGVVRET